MKSNSKISIMFFIIMTIAILGIFFYSTLRLWQMIPSGSIVRPILMIFVIFALSAFLIGSFGGAGLPVKATSVLYRFGASWFFIATFMVMIFLVLDLLRATNLLPLNQFMRESWLGFGIFAVVMVILMSAAHINYRNKKRSEVTIHLEKPIEGGSKKIVFISDLHLGYGIGKKEFESWIELINRERADLVLIGGDIVDHFISPLEEWNIAGSFDKIESKNGIYGVLGNHEYIAGVQKSIDFLKNTDITLLRDSSTTIAGLQLVGRDDLYSGNRANLADLVSPLNGGLPIILIDHQPTALNEANEFGVDLQLSGHTHKGQIFPGNLITKAIFELAYGYMQKGDTNYYVSSGIGVWGGKFRVASRSEYVVINIIGKK